MSTETAQLEAGPELDLLIAEIIFGTTEDDDFGPDGMPAFSTDIAAAWLIITHIGPQYLGWLTYRVDRYYAKIKGHIGDGSTPSLAICRAARAYAEQMQGADRD